MSWLTRLIHKDPVAEGKAPVAFTDIVELTRSADIAGLLRAFSLGDWETRELVAAALGNICRDSTPDVDYDRNEMIAALRAITELCTGDSTGGTYRENCLDHARMLLNRPEFNQPRAAEEETPVPHAVGKDRDDPIHVVKVSVDDLRAIFVGFSNITVSESEAHHVLSELMEQWNPKLYEAFNQTQTSVKIGTFSAPSPDLLHLKLAGVRDDEYPDCLAILQTGVFDICQRNTGSHINADVFLAIFLRTPAEKITVAAHGPELTLVPAEPLNTEASHQQGLDNSVGTAGADSAVSVLEFCETIAARLRFDPEPSNADASHQQGLDNSVGTAGAHSAVSVLESLDTIAARLRFDPKLCVYGLYILKFPDGFEEAYRKHLSFVEQLKSNWIYPSLSVYGIRSVSPEASVARLIVVTGDLMACEQLNDALYTREAEQLIASQYAGNWDAINPASSVSNVAQAGMSVDFGGVIEEVERLAREIRTGAYAVERTLEWDWRG